MTPLSALPSHHSMTLTRCVSCGTDRDLSFGDRTLWLIFTVPVNFLGQRTRYPDPGNWGSWFDLPLARLGECPLRNSLYSSISHGVELLRWGPFSFSEFKRMYSVTTELENLTDGLHALRVHSSLPSRIKVLRSRLVAACHTSIPH